MNEQENNKIAHLSFKLNNELFAVSAFKVLEVLEKQHITQIPGTPEYILGVINFRGDVLPVIDMRRKFGMPLRDEKAKFVIIVLDILYGNDSVRIGAVADAVKDVMEIDLKQIKEVPKIGTSYNTKFLSGMLSLDNGFIMMLNVDNIFTEEEVDLIQNAANGEQ